MYLYVHTLSILLVLLKWLRHEKTFLGVLKNALNDVLRDIYLYLIEFTLLLIF